MKKVLFVLLFSFSFVAFSQVKNETIMKEKIGSLTIEYNKKTNLENSNVDYRVYLLFQNQKYRSIVDTKIISFYSQESLDEFIKDLNASYKQMLTKEKVDISWSKNDYRLDLFDFSKSLYLNSVKDTGYTTLSIKQVESLIKNLSRIEFGKDALTK